MRCHFHHIIPYHIKDSDCQHNLSSLMLTLIPWLRKYLSRLSNPLSPFHAVVLGIKPLCTAHTSGHTWLPEVGLIRFPLPGIWDWDLEVLVSLLSLLELGVTQGGGLVHGEARKAGLKRENDECNKENEGNGTQPERERQRGENLPCLWSFQYLVPVPCKTQLHFLRLHLGRQPHVYLQ